MKLAIIAVILLLAVFAISCSSPEAPGSSEVQKVHFLSLGGTILDGDSATHADGDTLPVNVGRATEMALWANCSGDADVDGITYSVSADRTVWTTGSATLVGCENSGTKSDINDSAIQWIKFTVDMNASNLTGGVRMALSTK
jgi:hypothetical protein